MKQRGADWIYGRHAALSVIEQDPAGVLELWIDADSRGDEARRLEAAAREAGIAVQRVAKRTLEKHLGEVVHQGVAVRYRESRRRAPVDLDAVLKQVAEHGLLLLLDGVTDPHNLGACLRTANAAGANAVIVPRHRAAGLTPAARKVASGAAEHVALVQVANLAQAMTRISEAGFQLVGTDASALESLYDVDLRGPLALVLGGEERGLRRLTRERCHRLVSLPMAGRVESLNVAVAAGICLYEAVRQRRG